MANLTHLSEPGSGQGAGPGGPSAHRLPRAGTPRPGRKVWGPLPETRNAWAPRPSSLLTSFAPRRPRLGVPRRPAWADARAAGSRSSASFCHLEPRGPPGTFPFGLRRRSLLRFSELCRKGPAKDLCLHPTPCLPPAWDTARPGVPAPHRPRQRRPNFSRAVCAPCHAPVPRSALIFRGPATLSPPARPPPPLSELGAG